jgi:glutathione-dependent peroxiredoxin
MKNMEGQRIPDVTFRTREGHQWKDVTTKEIFAGKKVVVFALPGAFTPTCSSSHVPRYNELVPEFQRRGVDSVVCVSVNDTFVMNEWKKDQGADKITFLPDGNGEFTEKMGMLVDKRNLGFGPRSWRYSMLVEDGVVKKMFIEPEQEGDPFLVSDADTMLKHLDPQAKPPHDVVMFSREGCGFCVKAKKLLDEKGWKYEEVPASPRRLRAVSKKTSTPQIFVDGEYVGGCDELEKYLQKATLAGRRRCHRRTTTRWRRGRDTDAVLTRGRGVLTSRSRLTSWRRRRAAPRRRAPDRFRTGLRASRTPAAPQARARDVADRQAAARSPG